MSRRRVIGTKPIAVGGVKRFCEIASQLMREVRGDWGLSCAWRALADRPVNSPDIVYVEDEDSDALFLRRALRIVGSEAPLEVVRDARGLLRLLSERAQTPGAVWPAVLLLDVNLPAMTGFELLDVVRARSELADVAVIMVSSSPNADDVRQARALGADAYVVKPYAIDELLPVATAIDHVWRAASATSPARLDRRSLLVPGNLLVSAPPMNA